MLFGWFGSAGGFKGPSCGLVDANPAETGDGHEGFIVVWFSLVAIAVSVGGTFIMKKHRTAIGVGLFVGAIFVLVNYALCVIVLVGGQISKKKYMNETCQTDFGTTWDIFTLLSGIGLFLLYGAFGGLLVKAKDQLLSDAPLMGSQGGSSSSYPSGAFQNIDEQQEEQLTAV